MTVGMRVVLSAMADDRWHSTLSIARDTGLSTDFVRGALYNANLAGWVARGPVSRDLSDHGARSWRITKAGRAQLERDTNRKAR